MTRLRTAARLLVALSVSCAHTLSCAHADAPSTANTAAPVASAPAETRGLEGFFTFEQVRDPGWRSARGLAIEGAVLDGVRARSVKLVLASGEQEMSEAALLRLEALTCHDPAVRAWNEDRCAGFVERRCAEGACRYPHFGNCSGFAIGEGRILTAAHCVAPIAALGSDDPRRLDSSVLVADAGGDPPRRVAIEHVRLGKRDFDHDWVAVDDKRPLDVALLTVSDPALRALAPWPVAPVPAAGAAVFIHGFPRVEGRNEQDRASAGYELAAATPRFSFGRVADINAEGWPLCSPDGRQESWRLSRNCYVGPITVEGQRTWIGPITLAPFLGTWDTCNGYSGGPILDAQGRLVGVNATLLSAHSPQERWSDEMRQVATPAERALEHLLEAR